MRITDDKYFWQYNKLIGFQIEKLIEVFVFAEKMMIWDIKLKPQQIIRKNGNNFYKLI